MTLPRYAKLSPMRTEYRELSSVETCAINDIKTAGEQLWLSVDKLGDMHGDARELAIAKTKIEEAIMWAVKYITG